ncbi:MAG: glyoxalase [Saprospiraceae bacterium]
MKAKSIRAFLGAKNYDISRAFYREMGFEEVILDNQMSYFKVNENLGFYLQNAYVKDWVDNSMIFLEVEDLEGFQATLLQQQLNRKYQNVRISEIVTEDWGKEFFMHDPSGVLWHFGKFNG